VHHRRPDIPWIHLPRFVSAADPKPSFWSIYWSLWGGARAAPFDEAAVSPRSLAPFVEPQP
jgi:fatty acid desaturase